MLTTLFYHKISRRVFDLLENDHMNSILESSAKENAATAAKMLPREEEKYLRKVKGIEISEDVDGAFSSKNKSFDLYKRNAMAVVRREKFLDVICDSLTQYHYVGPSQRSDILLACRYFLVTQLLLMQYLEQSCVGHATRVVVLFVKFVFSSF